MYELSCRLGGLGFLRLTQDGGPHSLSISQTCGVLRLSVHAATLGHRASFYQGLLKASIAILLCNDGLPTERGASHGRANPSASLGFLYASRKFSASGTLAIQINLAKKGCLGGKKFLPLVIWGEGGGGGGMKATRWG